jgi:hypothetical protein
LHINLIIFVNGLSNLRVFQVCNTKINKSFKKEKIEKFLCDDCLIQVEGQKVRVGRDEREGCAWCLRSLCVGCAFAAARKDSVRAGSYVC